MIENNFDPVSIQWCPILFLAFVSDIDMLLQNASIKLFADDALADKPVENLDDRITFQ